MAETIGERLRRVRKDAGLSGPSLAKHLGVSAQTVSEWERDKYLPEVARLAVLAQLLHISVDYLLTGRKDLRFGGGDRGGGRLVPKIPFDALPDYVPRAQEAVTREMLQSHFPCGPWSFAFTIADHANAVQFMPGDSVIIDPDIHPTPGEMVLVATPAEALFRRYRPRGSHIELVPLNEDYELRTVELGSGARMLGVMSEHARRRR